MVNEDLWLNALIYSAESYEDFITIVPDVRYQNEADKMDFLIKVTRPDCEQVRAHKSEVGIPTSKADVMIDNNGTLEELYHACEEVLDMIKETMRNGKAA